MTMGSRGVGSRLGSFGSSSMGRQPAESVLRALAVLDPDDAGEAQVLTGHELLHGTGATNKR